MAQLLAFLGVSALVIVTPGQDTALTIRNTLVGGRRAGVLTAIGVSAGQGIWALAAAAGIAALLRASEPAFLAVRLAGGIYLVYLGAQALRLAFRGSPRNAQVVVARTGRGLVPLRQGVLSNLGNPKMAVFFTSLLPQFGGSFPALLALGLVFCSLTLVWLTAYATAVAKAGDFLRRPRIRRTLEGLTGTVLVGFGLRLASER
jgi:threonine/homoserine/homoserine lactone efflux protein